MVQDQLDRIGRERDFHNARFSEQSREAQDKYYTSIKRGAERFENRLEELAVAADVLEYGCGMARRQKLAKLAKSLTGIDISDVAIESAKAQARDQHLTNAHYFVMDGENMSFPHGAFDLVFGRGIIHHLDLERCFCGLARVLKPGGTALFWEPLGHNPLLNHYRAITPDARTPDEHPLLRRDFAIARKHFHIRELEFYGLTTILSVPVRETKLGDAVLDITGVIDRILFQTPVRWLAWYVLIELGKPKE